LQSSLTDSNINDKLRFIKKTAQIFW
jgi:hypothetical protein